LVSGKRTSEDSIPNSLKSNSEDQDLTTSSRKRKSEDPDSGNPKRKSEEFVIKEEGLSVSSEKKSRGDSLVRDP